MSKFTKTIAGFAGSIALIASLAGSAGAATFNTNLTVGSTGPDVVALQSWLVSKGYLVMPPGVSMGYFGTLTKNAVAAYQTAKGITPTAGYFGPTTRGFVNAEGGAMAGGSTVPGCSAGAMYSSTTGAPCASAGSTVPGCSAGAMYSSTTGAPCTSGSTSGGATGITTPGVEGTITVTESSAGIKSTVYEGDTMAPILGVQVEAKNSDVSVQRIKLDLGTTTKIYNKIYSKLYVTDGSNVLASVDLNSSNVVKGGTSANRYYVTVAGFNFTVPKDTKKVLTIKADVRGSIDSVDRSAGDSTLIWGIRLDTNGVRAIDGAGIDQYGGSTAIGKAITLSAELAETATINLSTNAATPKVGTAIASQGSSENELDGLTLLSFDVKAEKDSVTLTDMAFDIDKVGTGTAVASSTVYLYDGSTPIDSATVDSSGANGTYVVFSDVDYVVPKDVTKTLTLKVDVRSADGTLSALSANASSTGFTAENTKGDSVSVSGSATGKAQHVRNVGLQVVLDSKSISKSTTAAQNNFSTSTAQATFNLRLKAVGGAIQMGSVASTSPLVGSSTPYIVTYLNGAATTLLVASSTAFDVPSTIVDTSGLDNSFSLPENGEVTIPVTFTFEGRTAAGVAVSTGAYSIALERLNYKYSGAQTVTFMAGETDWRTSTVALP